MHDRSVQSSGFESLAGHFVQLAVTVVPGVRRFPWRLSIPLAIILSLYNPVWDKQMDLLRIIIGVSYDSIISVTVNGTTIKYSIITLVAYRGVVN